MNKFKIIFVATLNIKNKLEALLPKKNWAFHAYFHKQMFSLEYQISFSSNNITIIKEKVNKQTATYLKRSTSFFG